MLIMAFGLLGLAGLQVSGLNQNQSAYMRSQATVLAYDLADRMRANRSQIATYLAPANAGAGEQTAGCKTTTGCTAVQMANQDIFEWRASISILPAVIGSIAQTTGAGTATTNDDVFTVYINWDDEKDGDLDNNGDGNTDTDDALFTMSFKL